MTFHKPTKVRLQAKRIKNIAFGGIWTHECEHTRTWVELLGPLGHECWEWRCGESNPGLSACKADALPLCHIPDLTVSHVSDVEWDYVKVRKSRWSVFAICSVDRLFLCHLFAIIFDGFVRFSLLLISSQTAQCTERDSHRIIARHRNISLLYNTDTKDHGGKQIISAAISTWRIHRRRTSLYRNSK